MLLSPLRRCKCWNSSCFDSGLFLLVLVLMMAGSRGVPKPSVFIVSTLLARVMLWLWEERFEGARPRRGRRRRRGRVGEVDDASAGGGAGSE